MRNDIVAVLIVLALSVPGRGARPGLGESGYPDGAPLTLLSAIIVALLAPSPSGSMPESRHVGSGCALAHRGVVARSRPCRRRAAAGALAWPRGPRRCLGAARGERVAQRRQRGPADGRLGLRAAPSHRLPPGVHAGRLLRVGPVPALLR